MAINIKNLEERIQKKAHVVDSNTSVDDLTDMVEAALLLTGSLKTYADSSELPTATSSNEKIGFIQDIKAIKFNNGKAWVGMASGEVTSPAAAATQLYYGGATAGYVYPGEPSSGNQIDKIVFASNTISTNVFAFPGQRSAMSGGQGETKGYAMAGYIPGQPGSSGRKTDIYSFPFANEDAFSDIGYDLAGLGIYQANGEAIGPADHTYAYVAGGEAWPGTQNVISKFNTAVEAAGTDVGDLLAADYRNSAHSSATHGYVSTGYPASNVIEKWAFASDGNSTDVGDATEPEMDAQGISSLDYGYITGGRPDVPATATNRVEKFSFASDGNATDALDLFQGRHSGVGISSEDHGYTAGGATGQLSPTGTNTVDRFPFASDDNATDVGNLSNSHHNIARAGCQV